MALRTLYLRRFCFLSWDEIEGFCSEIGESGGHCWRYILLELDDDDFKEVRISLCLFLRGGGSGGEEMYVGQDNGRVELLQSQVKCWSSKYVPIY